MRTFQSIPDDHVAARDHNGDFLMVDTRRTASRGKVYAKAFGACPMIINAAQAIRDGMKVLGVVVGIYPAGRAQAFT